MVELRDLAVTEFEEPFGLQTRFGPICVLGEALDAGVGAETFPVKDVRCWTRFKRGDLIAKFLKSVMLGAAMRRIFWKSIPEAVICIPLLVLCPRVRK